ncbi:protein DETOXIFICATION 16-like [Gastrolobium bilobum]|uniref:protein DETOXIFICATION 16-like n=1 Tax=Gastrolobium bilobum TaxID=150636 RepID=UPI002AB129CD|nr:protein DETOXIFICATION 16-like [Gastrolobium bilobum]
MGEDKKKQRGRDQIRRWKYQLGEVIELRYQSSGPKTMCWEHVDDRCGGRLSISPWLKAISRQQPARVRESSHSGHKEKGNCRQSKGTTMTGRANERQAKMAKWRKEIADEAKKQIWLAGPMVFVCVFQHSLQMISLMFVGHLNELLLAGASLATSFVNVTGFCVLIGMSSALDTFCGQSYGAEEYHLVGIHMQRAMVVIMVVTIPQSIICANLKPILVALHQDQDIAAEAGLFALYLIPSLSANGLLRCIVKFLQTQNIVFPMLLASGFTTLTHVLVCWVLVLKLGLGIKGAVIAICISNWLNMVLLALYIRFSSSCKSTWTGFSRESLHNIPQFLRLAFPSAIMVCLEAWTFELMVILSGALPNPKLQTSVLSICFNTFGRFWMIPFGVSAAASTRISNELGAGCPKAAYLAVKVTLFMAFTVGALEFTLLLLTRNIWGPIFTNVPEVVNYMASMMPILASSAFVDSLQTAFQGIARGCGWQKLSAFINLGSYYLVGVPFAIVFAFVLHMNEKGLLLGIILALIVQVVCFLLVTLGTNWEKEANKAAIRVRGNSCVQVDVLALPSDQMEYSKGNCVVMEPKLKD